MNYLKSLLPLILIGLLSCQQAAEDPNTLTEQEQNEGWTLLFDGKSMDQWRSYLKEDISGWILEDGTMKALGLGGDEGGDIITRNQFENFELSLEWKIGEAGNSGILYMVKEDTGFHQVYWTGPEYQLIDEIGFPQELQDWQMTGANYAMHPAQNPEVNPAGEWNSSKIVKSGADVQHWLNGKKVVEYQLWTEDWEAKVSDGKWSTFPSYGRFKKGHISLQDHGSLAWFRNVKIREL
jgi:hypothetical protein